MKHNKHLGFVLVLVCTLLPFLLGQKVSAEENNSQVGFSVSPNYNEAQNKQSSFFDLTVQPSSKQTIGVTVTNTSTTSSKYTIQMIQASTNKNGIIDYSDPKGELVEAPFQLNQQATHEENITLEAGQTKEVPISISIPEKPFKGEVLGGINVTKEVAKGDKKSQLMNQYSYVIGLRLREEAEKPERKLTSGKAKPDVSFGQTGISVPIINSQPTAMGQLTVESILKRDGKEIKKDTFKNREIAPNSVYPYSLSWGRKDYVPGKYSLSLIITDAQSHKWIFEKEFTLKAEEVTKIKDAAVHPPKEQNLWLWGLIGLFVLIILLLLVYIFLTHKKKKRKEGADA